MPDHESALKVTVIAKPLGRKVANVVMPQNGTSPSARRRGSGTGKQMGTVSRHGVVHSMDRKGDTPQSLDPTNMPWRRHPASPESSRGTLSEVWHPTLLQDGRKCGGAVAVSAHLIMQMQFRLTAGKPQVARREATGLDGGISEISWTGSRGVQKKRRN
uniref:Uncharacterized protein n=1 Tax=Branchiostoma floridae TaxID=7739 RepID=C3ZLA3_BRAFL|eukprot:XP_002590774.1 hypothetical protein BRAFLDRAFT_78189 [Branchiostoma floridae]